MAFNLVPLRRLPGNVPFVRERIRKGGSAMTCDPVRILVGCLAMHLMMSPGLGAEGSRSPRTWTADNGNGTFNLDGHAADSGGAAANVRRGTEILVADSPLGPFEPLGRGPQTPPDWMALDGTLWIEDGIPYMVFCHEWVQITDGSFDIVRLSEDLAQPVGEPQTLFHASEAPWVRCRGDIGELYQGRRHHAYVSDGAWLHRTGDGTLLMLWSSYGPRKYAVGIARSTSGGVFGPWEQLPDPLWSDDGGHPMLFETFDGRLVMVIHQPNRRVERARFFEIEDLGDTLRIKSEIGGW